MTKRITIQENEYFKILELKGKYGESGLYGLLVLLDRLASYAKDANGYSQPFKTEQPEQPEQPERHNNTRKKVKEPFDFDYKNDKIQDSLLSRDIDICTCGHPISSHYDDGCMADGGLCECKKYTEQQGTQVTQP